MMRKLLEILGFRSLITSPERTFLDLRLADVPKLVEAHLKGGNDEFHENALSEFLLMKAPKQELTAFWKDMERIDTQFGEPGKKNGLDTDRGKAELERYLVTLLR